MLLELKKVAAVGRSVKGTKGEINWMGIQQNRVDSWSSRAP